MQACIVKMLAGERKMNELATDKLENHGHAVALHFMHYNFCRLHKTLRVTPAMEAGLTNHIWNIEELLAARRGLLTG
jgi:hypothetical protein